MKSNGRRRERERQRETEVYMPKVNVVFYVRLFKQTELWRQPNGKSGFGYIQRTVNKLEKMSYLSIGLRVFWPLFPTLIYYLFAYIIFDRYLSNGYFYTLAFTRCTFFFFMHMAASVAAIDSKRSLLVINTWVYCCCYWCCCYFLCEGFFFIFLFFYFIFVYRSNIRFVYHVHGLFSSTRFWYHVVFV